MAESEPPKIVVDSDWKAQAQAEKERLAAKEREAAARAAPAGGAAGAPGGRGAEELPAPDFMALVSMLATNALTYLGAFPDPQTGRAVVAPDYARVYIDLMGILEEKTKGNLTEEESRDLAQVLSELRLRYVEITKFVAQELAKQAAGKGGGAGGPGPGGVPDLRLGG